MDKATKEKILEIAGLCNRCLEGNPSHPSDGCYSCDDRGAYYGALKMAEWKQVQMIEKAVKWLEDNINNYIFNDTYQLPSGKKSRDWFKIKSECFSDFRNAMED